VTLGAPLDSVLTHRVHFESNRLPNFNLFKPPYRWERWFDRLLSQGSRVPFFLQLPGAVAGGAGDCRVRMWGLGSSIGSGLSDHVARIYWHHVLADTAGWDLANPQDLSASGLTIGSRLRSRSRFRRSRDPIFPLMKTKAFALRSQSLFAWFEITYRGDSAALNDTISSRRRTRYPAPVSIRVPRFGYHVRVAPRRTDPESPVRLSGVWTGSAPNFTLTVEDSLGPARRPRYSLLSLARAARPSTIARYAPAASARAIPDLLDPGNGADYLIVVPPAFLSAAETLAVYRELKLPGIPSPRVRIATTDRGIVRPIGSGRPVPPRSATSWSTPRAPLGSAAARLRVSARGRDLGRRTTLGSGPRLDSDVLELRDPSTLSQFTRTISYVPRRPRRHPRRPVVGRLPAGERAGGLGPRDDQAPGSTRRPPTSTSGGPGRSLAADDANKRDQPDPLGNEHVNQMEQKGPLSHSVPARGGRRST
jgi:hypothetical protein